MSNKDNEKARDLFFAWKKGWPSYIPNTKDDYPAIIRLAETCAKIAGIHLDEEEGYMRIKNGLANIALYCSQSIKWSTQNLFLIEVKYQDVLLEMNAWSKAKNSDKEKLKQQEIIYNEAKRKREEKEKLIEESSNKALIEQINTWIVADEYSYYIYNITNKKVVLSQEEAAKKLQEISEENRKDIYKMYEKRIKEYKKLAIKKGLKF